MSKVITMLLQHHYLYFKIKGGNLTQKRKKAKSIYYLDKFNFLSSFLVFIHLYINLYKILILEQTDSDVISSPQSAEVHGLQECFVRCKVLLK